MKARFNYPTRILFGEGVATDLPQELRALEVTRPLVCTDRGPARSPIPGSILELLRSSGLEAALFSEVSPNPGDLEVEAGARSFREHRADSLVALGGGSPMDAAKAIQIRIHHQAPLETYDDLKGGDALISGALPPHVALPTTAGTGSEVSRSAVITTLAMVGHLLETRTLSPELEELILVKTEGVPLFVEEFIRSFRDLKIMVRRNHHYQLARNLDSVAIPSTIQEVIMAPVDSLPEGPRDLLQTASVIDREFSHELIKRASSLPEPELLSRLSILKNAELLYEKDIYPQSTYIFRHALTREVVYDSLLSRRKKQLHDRIGKAMEQIYSHHLSKPRAMFVDD